MQYIECICVQYNAQHFVVRISKIFQRTEQLNKNLILGDNYDDKAKGINWRHTQGILLFLCKSEGDFKNCYEIENRHSRDASLEKNYYNNIFGN